MPKEIPIHTEGMIPWNEPITLFHFESDSDFTPDAVIQQDEQLTKLKFTHSAFSLLSEKLRSDPLFAEAIFHVGNTLELSDHLIQWSEQELTFDEVIEHFEGNQYE
jgi:hypothetical protein